MLQDPPIQTPALAPPQAKPYPDLNMDPEWEEYAASAARKLDIPDALWRSLYRLESQGGRHYLDDGKTIRRPPGGDAMGIGQVRPGTAAQYGVSPAQLADPFVNIAVSLRYLKDNYDLLRPQVETNGEGWALALAAYHAGPGTKGKNAFRALRDRGVGDINMSTQDYVRDILNMTGETGGMDIFDPPTPRVGGDLSLGLASGERRVNAPTPNDLLHHLGMTPQEYQQYPSEVKTNINIQVSRAVQEDARKRQAGQTEFPVSTPYIEENRQRLQLPPLAMVSTQVESQEQQLRDIASEQISKEAEAARARYYFPGLTTPYKKQPKYTPTPEEIETRVAQFKKSQAYMDSPLARATSAIITSGVTSGMTPDMRAGVVGGIGGLLTKGATILDYMTPTGLLLPRLGYKENPLQTLAGQITAGSQLALEENKPTGAFGGFLRGLQVGAGRMAVDLPTIIATGGLGAANLPLHMAAARGPEGPTGMLKGGIEGLVYHYGMGATSQLSPLKNAFIWAGVPTVQGTIERTSQGIPFGQAVGESLGEGFTMGALSLPAPIAHRRAIRQQALAVELARLRGPVLPDVPGVPEVTNISTLSPRRSVMQRFRDLGEPYSPAPRFPRVPGIDISTPQSLLRTYQVNKGGKWVPVKETLDADMNVLDSNGNPTGVRINTSENLPYREWNPYPIPPKGLGIDSQTGRVYRDGSPDVWKMEGGRLVHDPQIERPRPLEDLMQDFNDLLAFYEVQPGTIETRTFENLSKVDQATHGLLIRKINDLLNQPSSPNRNTNLTKFMDELTGFMESRGLRPEQITATNIRDRFNPLERRAWDRLQDELSDFYRFNNLNEGKTRLFPTTAKHPSELSPTFTDPLDSPIRSALRQHGLTNEEINAIEPSRQQKVLEVLDARQKQRILSQRRPAGEARRPVLPAVPSQTPPKQGKGGAVPRVQLQPEGAKGGGLGPIDISEFANQAASHSSYISWSEAIRTRSKREGRTGTSTLNRRLTITLKEAGFQSLADFWKQSRHTLLLEYAQRLAAYWEMKRGTAKDTSRTITLKDGSTHTAKDVNEGRYANLSQEARMWAKRLQDGKGLTPDMEHRLLRTITRYNLKGDLDPVVKAKQEDIFSRQQQGEDIDVIMQEEGITLEIQKQALAELTQEQQSTEVKPSVIPESTTTTVPESRIDETNLQVPPSPARTARAGSPSQRKGRAGQVAPQLQPELVPPLAEESKVGTAATLQEIAIDLNQPLKPARIKAGQAGKNPDIQAGFDPESGFYVLRERNPITGEVESQLWGNDLDGLQAELVRRGVPGLVAGASKRLARDRKVQADLDKLGPEAGSMPNPIYELLTLFDQMLVKGYELYRRGFKTYEDWETLIRANFPPTSQIEPHLRDVFEAVSRASSTRKKRSSIPFTKVFTSAIPQLYEDANSLGLKGAALKDYIQSRLITSISHHPDFNDLSPVDAIKAYNILTQTFVDNLVKNHEARTRRLDAATEAANRHNQVSDLVAEATINRFTSPDLAKKILSIAEEYRTNPNASLGALSRISQFTQDALTGNWQQALTTLQPGSASQHRSTTLASLWKSRVSVMAELLGEPGATLNIKLYEGDQKFRELQDKLAPYLLRMTEVTEAIKDPSVLNEFINEVAQALELPNSADLTTALPTDAHRMYYQNARSALDFVKGELQLKGVRVIEEGYLPHERIAEFLENLLTEVSAEDVLKSKGSLTQRLQVSSPFLERRQDIMGDNYRTDLPALLPRYFQSVSKVIAFQDAVDYYHSQLLPSLPAWVKKSNLSVAQTLMQNSLNPQQGKGWGYRAAFAAKRNTARALLAYAVKSTLQNMTQRELTNMRVMPEARDLAKLIYRHEIAAMGPLLNAVDMARSRGLQLMDYMLDDPGIKSKWWVVRTLDANDFYQMSERASWGNWRDAERKGVANRVVKHPDYKPLIQYYLNEAKQRGFKPSLAGAKLKAANKIMEDPKIFDEAVREGSVLAAETQVSADPAMRAEFYDKLFNQILGQFTAFKFRQIQLLAEQLRSQEGFRGRRAQLVLRNGFAEAVPFVDALKMVEDAMEPVRLLREATSKSAQGTGVSMKEIDSFLSHLRSQVRDLNQTIKQLEPTGSSNPAVRSLHVARYISLVSAIGMGVRLFWEAVEAQAWPDEEKKKKGGYSGSEMIRRATIGTITDVLPVPWQGLDPSEFLSPPTIPSIETTRYGNFYPRGVVRGLTKWALTVAPPPIGLLERSTKGRLLSGPITNTLIAPGTGGRPAGPKKFLFNTERKRRF